jgi:hypothetical protein
MKSPVNTPLFRGTSFLTILEIKIVPILYILLEPHPVEDDLQVTGAGDLQIAGFNLIVHRNILLI